MTGWGGGGPAVCHRHPGCWGSGEGGMERGAPGCGRAAPVVAPPQGREGDTGGAGLSSACRLTPVPLRTLLVLVLSLLHSADLHCEQALGIAWLSQLILSPDFHKQSRVLTLVLSRPVPPACRYSLGPFYRNAAPITPAPDSSSGWQPDHSTKK